MASTITGIAVLGLYQRVPGNYFCHHLEETDESFDRAVSLLAEASMMASWVMTDSGRWMCIEPYPTEPKVHQTSMLGVGDVITFHRTYHNELPWSVRTYSGEQFAKRYRFLRMARPCSENAEGGVA